MLKDLEQRQERASPVTRLVESLGVRTESLSTRNKTVWRLLFPASAVLLAVSFLLIKGNPDSGVVAVPPQTAVAAGKPAKSQVQELVANTGLAADPGVRQVTPPEPVVEAVRPAPPSAVPPARSSALLTESSAAAADAVAASRAAPVTAPTVAARGDSSPETSRKASEPEPAVVPAVAREKPEVAVSINDIKRPASTAQQAESHYRRALDYLQASRIEPAIAELREVVRLQADMHVARELLANLYLRSGREAEAFIVLKAGIDASPQYLPFAKMYARTLVEQGQLPAARRVLESSLLYAGNDADYQALLAAVEQRLGEHDAAISRYMRALELNRQKGAWWVGMGISLEALGRTTEAGQAYRAARLTPGLSADLIAYVDARLKQLGSRS
jgi:MSHA biogenesis protein MshN